jgi:hypothetical protein
VCGGIYAQLLLQLALRNGVQIRPHVINVDGHQAYAHAITELKGDRPTVPVPVPAVSASEQRG